MERVDVAVAGAGQAGLSVSRELTRAHIDHVVLERRRVAQSWRDRWNTFCLVTPNWSIDLPGRAYDGDDPDGFLARDDLVTFLEDYGRGAPVRQGVGVSGIEAGPSGFLLRTTDGEIRARAVVACTGAYQRAVRPPEADALPAGVLQMDVGDYTGPAALPDGDVLLVGSGQTGCQLAEELHEAGRRVVLSCGKAPWVLRRYGDRDVFWWLAQTGYFEADVASLPAPGARLVSNPLTTGHGGGHDLHLRTLRAMGVTLVGRFLGGDGGGAVFAPDLAESVAWGDARYAEMASMIRRVAGERGIPIPDTPDPAPFDPEAPERVPLAGFGSVIFTGGFRPDYGSWIPWPEAFDDLGFPIQADGASGVVDGLFFAGVHFLRKRKSAILLGAREDAEIVASGVAKHLGA